MVSIGSKNVLFIVVNSKFSPMKKRNKSGIIVVRQAERYQIVPEKALHQIRAVLYLVRSVPAGIG